MMTRKHSAFALMWLGLLVGCGDDETSDAQTTAGAGLTAGAPTSQTGDQSSATTGLEGGVVSTDDAGSTGSPVTGGSNGGDAGASSGGDAGEGEGTTGGAAAPYDYEQEEVTLTEDLMVPAGTTLRVGPGVRFTAQQNVKVDVQGTLEVQGSEAAPSAFVGAGEPDSWHGIVVASGGSLTLDHAQVSGATYGIHAMPGSSYHIDHAHFDTSFKAMVLQSDGSLSNCVVEAVLSFPAVTDAVTIDDPNGALTIMDASPVVTNCRFEGSGGLNDMIRVGGEASPEFDHISVTNSHCGFHTSGGTNTSTRITNSRFDNLAYGVMAYATQPVIEDSVFLQNSTDVGVCSGATDANTPVLRNNYYNGGAVRLDASCDLIGTRDSAPATAEHPGAGSQGL